MHISAEHKDLFLFSMLGMHRLPCVNSPALIAAHGPLIQRATPSESLRCGVAEQCKIQLDKLKAEIAGLEIINMPTFMSRPSSTSPLRVKSLLILLAFVYALAE